MKKLVRLAFKSTLKLLDFSVSTLMLCFFSCFRSHRPSSPSSTDHFDCSSAHYVSPENDKEIRDEAKFLKECGTLPETPIEIRKASNKLNASSPPSEFHSWLPNASVDALRLDSEIDHSSTSLPLLDHHTPISCMSKTHKRLFNGEDDAENEAAVMDVNGDEADDITTPFVPWPSSTNIQSRTKSVRFECDFDTAAAKGEDFGCQISKKMESPWQPSISKRTPKLTPLKLTDEMHTPGTVFPNNGESYGNGKGRVRSQYVYSVSNPTELRLSVAENN